MSYFKPDYDYDPLNSTVVPDLEEKVPQFLESKQDLYRTLRQFISEIPDSQMIGFGKATSLSFKTNTNVFDSIAFFKKFCDAYLFSIKKTFPHLSEKDVVELEENFQQLQENLDNLLKSSNVENKYLLPLLLGALAGILDYENY
jgi:hypothetical protein